ncbi:MAG: hypothetical protein K8L99_13685 [Anaerolineae bacterium]|nr:hypothetical protein [Anaerolineae bacterium]
MQIRSRLLVLTMLALLLMIVPVSLAQDNAFGLSPDDYALFTQGNAQSAISDSVAFDFSVVLNSTENALDLTGTGLIGSSDGLAQITISGTASAPDEVSGEVTEQPVDLEIRVVGDMLYIDNKTDDQGWQGTALDNAMNEIVGGAGLPINPEDLAAGDVSALTGGADMTALLGGVDELLATDFIVMSRLDDENVNGVDTAHFNTHINLAAVTEAEGLLSAALTAGGMVSGSEEEIASQVQFFIAILQPMLEGINIDFDEYISTGDTNQVQRGVLAIDLSIPSPTGEGEPITLGLNVTVNITDYAPTVSVEAPAEYTEIDAAS